MTIKQIAGVCVLLAPFLVALNAYYDEIPWREILGGILGVALLIAWIGTVGWLLS